MLKQTIKYTDFDGNEREEDFYFNLTKAELMEMELSTEGGLEKRIKAVVAAQDTKAIINIFKDIIIRSYGVKSPDGKRFIKNDDVRDEFVQSEAYSELFMQLATDEKAAANFINGITPKIEGGNTAAVGLTQNDNK